MAKRLRIFAGPNGSGKSSLVNVIKKDYKIGHFINADVIFRSLSDNSFFDFEKFGISNLEPLSKMIQNRQGLYGLSKTDYSKLTFEGSKLCVASDSLLDNYFAGGIATFIYNQLILADATFSYETVMSDERKIDQFKKAKDQGFRFYLYFVCTDDPNINIGRIDQRVANQEHDVPDEVVIKRYYKVFEHLLDVIKLSDRAYLFDNSNQLTLFMEIEGGQKFMTKGELPRWFIEQIYPKLDIVK